MLDLCLDFVTINKHNYHYFDTFIINYWIDFVILLFYLHAKMKLFNRKIILLLRQWANSPDRKPLILRGARQVGKTTAINIFSKEFDQYIYLDMEKTEESALFKRNLSVYELLQSIYLHKNISPKKGRMLLFIDEIQNSPEAVSILRYFYEEIPDLFVIAAGSLFEIMITSKQISFPVGRIEFLYLYPLTFEEFLIAMDEENALQLMKSIPLPEYSFNKLMKLFHTFTLVGGMPEIVAKYRQTQKITDLNSIFESLFTAYSDDISKYAKNESMRNILKHCIESAPYEAGKRIIFAGFGKSNYRSREIGEALRTLERAKILYLLYPAVSTEIPILPNKKKSPRLQFFDTGILNFRAGLQKFYYEFDNLHSFYKGILAEHIVGQEFLALDSSTSINPVFWTREKKQSSAEIDFILQFERYVIPVEVKSGTTGTLRSIHQFMNRCDHPYAIRLYSGPLKIDKTKTPEGSNFFLLNMPYFLAGKVSHYLGWFMQEVNGIT